MKVLIPLASHSSFFPKADFPFPVPLIEVAGKTIIERVVENYATQGESIEFIFVVLKSDEKKFSLDRTLDLITGGKCQIVSLNHQTQGAACSALMAIESIGLEEELIIVNGDQFLDVNLQQVFTRFRQQQADAGLVTFSSVHPRWSYVKTNAQGQVLQAEEKKVISKNAIAGFYYFRQGKDFISAVMNMIEAGRSVNDAYYIAPCLNDLVLQNKKVSTFKISSKNYHSFYSPSKLKEFDEFLLKQSLSAPLVEEMTDYHINLIIPAAGEGSRFEQAGYLEKKPFIPVMGKPMIQHVLENLSTDQTQTTVLLRNDHIESEQENVNDLIQSGVNVVCVDQLTEGTACTVLLARKYYDSNYPMMIANSDQYVDFDCQAFIDDCRERDLDGSIVVFREPDLNPKWSYAKTNDDGIVSEVAEKDPISDLATVGIYYFKRGADYVKAATDMIALNDRVNNEFYTCPVFNYMIKNDLKIGVYEIPLEAMHGMGTPEDLEEYLAVDEALEECC